MNYEQQQKLTIVVQNCVRCEKEKKLLAPAKFAAELSGGKAKQTTPKSKPAANGEGTKDSSKAADRKHQTAEKKKKEQVQTDATDDGDKKKGKQEDKAKGKNENHILDDDEITDDDGRAENQAHDSSAILEDIGPGFGDCKVETSSGDEGCLPPLRFFFN